MTDRLPHQDGARELLDLSAALDRDEERRSNGERPVYAMDSNVAIFLSQPSDRATGEIQRGIRREGFGTVLEGDPTEMTEVVAHALAEHIYVNLRGSSPLLLVPPVAGEVHAHALQLAREYVSPSEQEKQRWRGEANRLIRLLESTGSFGERAERLIRDLQELLFIRYGPAAALRRLRRVFAERGILSSDVAFHELDDDLRAAFDPQLPAAEVVALTLRANKWMEAGLDRQRGDRADFKDAFVVARLERANELLERRGSAHRVIYLTADRRLLRVVGEDRPHLRLRHPRAWLTRLSIFQSDEEQGRQPLVDLLRFRSQSGGDADRDAVERINEEWRSYLARATDSFVPLAETRDLFFNRTKDMVARYSVSVDRFQDEIGELQERAYENCFEVASETAATEAQRSGTFYARTVPPLVFEGWPVTQRTIETFLSWHVPADFDATVFRTGLAEIDREDPTRYARHIALAAIFAGRGRWDEAASLAGRAGTLAIARGSRPGDPNGREAAFLEAVARRHVAHGEADLDAALAILEQGEATAKRERASTSEGCDRESDVVLERFEAERLASRASRFYFRRYGRDGGVMRDEREQAWLLMGDFSELLTRLRDRLDALETGACLIARQALSQLMVRTVTNILGLALLTRAPPEAAENAWSEAERLGLTGRGADDLSSIVAITMLAYQRLSGRGRSSADYTRLRRHLYEYHRYYVFPYDAPRFAEIDRLLSGR